MLIKLLKYNTWANRAVATQVEPFPIDLFEKNVGGSFGSLKATMVHLLESDWLWLKRFHGIPLAPELPKWDTSSPATLHKAWKEVQDDMLEVVNTLTVDKQVEFITRKGAHLIMPLEDIILHLTQHGSYHRGQLTHIIRQLGQQPVSTDYFVFYNTVYTNK